MSKVGKYNEELNPLVTFDCVVLYRAPIGLVKKKGTVVFFARPRETTTEEDSEQRFTHLVTFWSVFYVCEQPCCVTVWVGQAI